MKKLTVHLSAICLTVFLLVQQVNAANLLIPVGQVIGLEIQGNQVTVAGFDTSLGEAAREAGLLEGDQIMKIDDKQILCTEDVRNALKASDGDVDISVLREKAVHHLEMEPVITPDGPKLGVFLRQGISGVGTVTYYDPDSGVFGALGHGINDKSGDLIPMVSGSAYSATVDTIKKGKAGDPGQLMGSVTDMIPIAALSKNTLQGIFGIASVPFRGDPLPTAAVSEIETGPAMIRSTIQNGTIKEYSVEILKIYPSSGADGRNMLLRVTDSRLLESTGGIVQGMSGSPIIQDGKLVGAVTHVCVT